MRFDADFLQEVKYQNEIVSLISSYVNLKKAGRLMSGLCPFHAEKSPSFMVYPDTQSYYCFGCGAGGDAITFIMGRENLDYGEAVRFLCERAGIPLPEEDMERETTDLRRRIYEMNKAAARFYHEKLLSNQGKEAVAYLQKRGFEMPIIRKFGIGFAPDSWDETVLYLKKQGFHEAELLQGWLAGRSSRTGRLYDQFRNRVMFPVFDLRGNVIAFSGRTLDPEEKRKYLNSGDTAVFRKSRNLFAMNFAKNKASEFLLLCEGNLDVVALHKSGFENAVASLGTALTEEQVRIIASYTEEVVVSYDADEAGQKATAKAIELLRARGLKVRVLTIPDAKDPDEYIKKFGAIRFARLIAEAKDATTWQMEREKKSADLSDPAEKGAYLKRLLPTLANLSFVEQDLQLARLSEELGVAKEAIAADLRIFLQKRKQKEQAEQKRDFSIAGKTGYDKINPDRSKHFKAAQAEEMLLGRLFTHPEEYASLKDPLMPEDFITPFNKRVAECLIPELEAGNRPDLCRFGERFTPEEVGRISGMMAKMPPISDPEAVLADCVATLKAEKEKKSAKDVADLQGDDLKAFIAGLGKKKKS
ncbi:MAG: DNA primase [Oscillospiraceae bacterium]|nr:DNA primase [Oscillospiraceae bacterium]